MIGEYPKDASRDEQIDWVLQVAPPALGKVAQEFGCNIAVRSEEPCFGVFITTDPELMKVATALFEGN